MMMMAMMAMNAENQFFISSTGGAPVENDIAAIIFERIRKAVVNGEVFRVVVILPVHPDGTYATSASVRNIMRYAPACVVLCACIVCVVCVCRVVS
jgi:hypothetical protein